MPAIFLLLTTLFCAAHLLAQDLPWPDGEKLSYLISWGPLDAAEGTFTARHDPQQQGMERFVLTLRSRGPIEAFFPIRSRLASLTQLQPWRSREYTQDRNEGGNVRNRKTIPDYSVKLGRYFPAPGKPEENFELLDGPYEDFGSMLYHLRLLPWKKGESITWNVIENKEPLFGKMTCIDISEKELADLPARRWIEILGVPTSGSRRHQGDLRLWMTDDARRIPVLAKLKFQYGTFSIRLIRGGGDLDLREDGEPIPVLSESDPQP